MKIRRPAVTAVVLLLVVGVAGGLVGGSNPAHAVVSIASSGTSIVPYSGTVDGPQESIFLSGYVLIKMMVVRDPDFGKTPTVRLDIDLSNVTGVGLKTGATYVASGNQDLVRPLAATDVVEITFAVVPNRAAMSTRTALASFAFNFNVATGTFIQATASTAVDAAVRLAPLQ